MDVLESSLEALFLSNCYFTAANCLWTWVAVVTAALSFWRITTVGSKSNAPPPFRDHTANDTPLPSVPTTQTPSPHVSLSSVGDDGLLKGKFTAYYEDDGVEEEENSGVEIDGDVDGVCSVWETYERFEIELPVLRTEDLGWYRCLDLTVLNGNVVRLWDDKERRTSPLKRVWVTA